MLKQIHIMHEYASIHPSIINNSTRITITMMIIVITIIHTCIDPDDSVGELMRVDMMQEIESLAGYGVGYFHLLLSLILF